MVEYFPCTEEIRVRFTAGPFLALESKVRFTNSRLRTWSVFSKENNNCHYHKIARGPYKCYKNIFKTKYYSFYGENEKRTKILYCIRKQKDNWRTYCETCYRNIEFPECNCLKKTVQRIVTKETPNKGRKFYVCKERKCNVFIWH